MAKNYNPATGKWEDDVAEGYGKVSAPGYRPGADTAGAAVVCVIFRLGVSSEQSRWDAVGPPPPGRAASGVTSPRPGGRGRADAVTRDLPGPVPGRPERS